MINVRDLIMLIGFTIFASLIILLTQHATKALKRATIWLQMFLSAKRMTEDEVMEDEMMDGCM